jgi:tape measure domain-containing protein
MTGVNIKVRADARQAQNEMRKLNTSMESIDRQAKNVTRTFQRLAMGITAAIGGTAFTRGITRASDSMTDFGNRVNLVTQDVAKTQVVMRELFDIAARSRGSVDAAAETFNRFGLALQDADKPLSELLIVTEAVQQAAVISGAGAESAKAAIVQLGQGLASGQLRGQELNSVLEQMPRLARAIADGMGIPFGKLREEAMAGRVTAEAVYAAILSGAAEIDREFATLDVTTAGLFVVLKNEFTRAVAEMDKVVGISASVKDSIFLATQAVRYFGQNIGDWAFILGSELLIAKSEVILFSRDVKEALGDLFSGSLDGAALAQSVVDALENVRIRAKEKIDEISLSITTMLSGFTPEAIIPKAIDLSTGLFTGLKAAKDTISSFVSTIAGYFRGLWLSVVGKSTWTGIFDQSHEEGGAKAIGNTSHWKGLLDATSQMIGNWTSALAGVFVTLNKNITTQWSNLVKYVNGLGFETVDYNNLSSGFDSAITGMKSTWDSFSKYLTTKTVQTGQGPEEVDTNFGAWMRALEQIWDSVITSMSNRWDSFYDFLTKKEIEVPGGIVKVETEFGKTLRRIKEAYGEFSTSLPPLENFALTKTIQTPGGEETIDTPLYANAKAAIKGAKELLAGSPLVIGIEILGRNLLDNLGNIRDNIIEFFDVNKDIMSAAIAVSFSVALKAKLNEKFGKMLLRGGIITAVIAAAGSLGNEPKFVEAAKSVAQGLGEAIRKVLEGGEGDFVGSLGKGLITLAKELGKSFIDGLFPTSTIASFDPFGDAIEIKNPQFDEFGDEVRNTLLDNIAGVFVGLAAALLISPKIVMFMSKLALGMSKKIGRSFLKSKSFGFIKDGISVGMIKAGKGASISKKFQTGFENVGILAGRSMRVGLLAANAATMGLMAQQMTDAFIPEDSLGGAGEVLDGAAAGLVIGAQLGSVIPGVGTAIGAAVGAAVGLGFDIYNNPTLRAKIAEMGVAVKDFFVNGWESAKDTIAEGFDAMFDGLFPSWLKGLFVDRNQEKFDGLVEATGGEDTGPAVDELLTAYGNVSQSLRDNLDEETQTRVKHLAEVNNDTRALGHLGVSVNNTADKLQAWANNLSKTINPLLDGVLYGGINESQFKKSDLHGFATGGPIRGPGTGTSDDIPAMLSNGEFVMQQSAVQKFGPGFMARINAGIMPQSFSNGGLARSVSRLESQHAKVLSRAETTEDYRIASEIFGRLQAARRRLEASQGVLDDGSGSSNTGAGAGAGASSVPKTKTEKPEKTEAAEIGESYAQQFQADFNSGLKQLLRDGDVKGFLTGLLDSFTGGIIDSVVDGFTANLFGNSAEEGGVLSNLFSGMFNWGGGVKDGVAKNVEAGVTEGGTGFLSGISGFFSNMFSGLGDMFKGGGAGEGGFFSSIFSGIGKIFGFSQGGVVPSTPFSQAGKDSVPAMLMPGEVVLSKNAVARQNMNQGQQQVFNINVSGDVSRQTRQEIVKMMPQITAGVNMGNKENNFRRS